jgi:hypothetical protein
VKPTAVYDAYWRFAAERQAIMFRRLSGQPSPWTQDPILRAFRFTNPYRVADRVTQYLLRHVIYGKSPPQDPDDVFFRTILFKLFNRTSTWSLIEAELGPISWGQIGQRELIALLDKAFSAGISLYSAAYIMPAPRLGWKRKHSNHIALLFSMMEDGLPARLTRATSLHEAYRLLLAWPSLGKFLAFQYVIDLNYTPLIDFPEADLVIAGPGARDGIAKCFGQVSDPEAIIIEVCKRQEEEFHSRGLQFQTLNGRLLQPIDCQNLFCEISKYARISHPEVRGLTGRTRIKQAYRISPELLSPIFLPPKWASQGD